MGELSDYELTDSYAVPQRPDEPMVVLRPGDKVLLAFSGRVDMEDIRKAMDQLCEWFPDVEFYGVSGEDMRVIVDRGEGGDDDG